MEIFIGLLLAFLGFVGIILLVLGPPAVLVLIIVLIVRAMRKT